MSWGSSVDKEKGIWTGCLYGSGVGPRGCKHAILWNVSACSAWQISGNLEELQPMPESLPPFLEPMSICPAVHNPLLCAFLSCPQFWPQGRVILFYFSCLDTYHIEHFLDAWHFMCFVPFNIYHNTMKQSLHLIEEYIKYEMNQFYL